MARFFLCFLLSIPLWAGPLFDDPLDGRAAPGWIVAPDRFEKTPGGDAAFFLASDVPRMTAPAPAVGDDAWKNYRLTLEILPAAGKGFLGVDFNVRKSDACGANIHFSTSAADLVLQAMRFCGAGSESWKLWPVSQRRLPFPRGRWIRLRIDVGETVANVYVDGDPEPLYTIYDLPSSAGGVRFWASYGGSGFYRRLRVESLPPGSVKPVLPDFWEAAAAKANLRDWRVTELLPAGTEALPRAPRWTPVQTDRRGVLDLAAVFRNYARNTVYAETTVRSARDGERVVRLTYLDRFTLFCNGREVFRGPDRHWFSPDREKYGNSRLIPDQFEVRLPLRAGENKLLVRTEALEQFGWGFWMRLE